MNLDIEGKPIRNREVGAIFNVEYNGGEKEIDASKSYEERGTLSPEFENENALYANKNNCK